MPRPGGVIHRIERTGVALGRKVATARVGVVVILVMMHDVFCRGVKPKVAGDLA